MRFIRYIGRYYYNWYENNIIQINYLINKKIKNVNVIFNLFTSVYYNVDDVLYYLNT